MAEHSETEASNFLYGRRIQDGRFALAAEHRDIEPFHGLWIALNIGPIQIENASPYFQLVSDLQSSPYPWKCTRPEAPSLPGGSSHALLLSLSLTLCQFLRHLRVHADVSSAMLPTYALGCQAWSTPTVITKDWKSLNNTRCVSIIRIAAPSRLPAEWACWFDEDVRPEGGPRVSQVRRPMRAHLIEATAWDPAEHERPRACRRHRQLRCGRAARQSLARGKSHL